MDLKTTAEKYHIDFSREWIEEERVRVSEQPKALVSYQQLHEANVYFLYKLKNSAQQDNALTQKSIALADQLHSILTFWDENNHLQYTSRFGMTNTIGWGRALKPFAMQLRDEELVHLETELKHLDQHNETVDLVYHFTNLIAEQNLLDFLQTFARDPLEKITQIRAVAENHKAQTDQQKAGFEFGVSIADLIEKQEQIEQEQERLREEQEKLKAEQHRADLIKKDPLCGAIRAAHERAEQLIAKHQDTAVGLSNLSALVDAKNIRDIISVVASNSGDGQQSKSDEESISLQLIEQIVNEVNNLPTDKSLSYSTNNLDWQDLTFDQLTQIYVLIKSTDHALQKSTEAQEQQLAQLKQNKSSDASTSTALVTIDEIEAEQQTKQQPQQQTTSWWGFLAGSTSTTDQTATNKTTTDEDQANDQLDELLKKVERKKIKAAIKDDKLKISQVARAKEKLESVMRECVAISEIEIKNAENSLLEEELEIKNKELKKAQEEEQEVEEAPIVVKRKTFIDKVISAALLLGSKFLEPSFLLHDMTKFLVTKFKQPFKDNGSPIVKRSEKIDTPMKKQLLQKEVDDLERKTPHAYRHMFNPLARLDTSKLDEQRKIINQNDDEPYKLHQNLHDLTVKGELHSVDKMLISRVTRFVFGYVTITSVGKIALPSIHMLLRPDLASRRQEHLGLIHYLTNPLLPLAVLTGILHKQMEMHKKKAQLNGNMHLSRFLAVCEFAWWLFRGPLLGLSIAANFLLVGAIMLTLIAVMAAVVITTLALAAATITLSAPFLLIKFWSDLFKPANGQSKNKTAIAAEKAEDTMKMEDKTVSNAKLSVRRGLFKTQESIDLSGEETKPLLADDALSDDHESSEDLDLFDGDLSVKRPPAPKMSPTPLAVGGSTSP